MSAESDQPRTDILFSVATEFLDADNIDCPVLDANDNMSTIHVSNCRDIGRDVMSFIACNISFQILELLPFTEIGSVSGVFT